MFESLVSGGLMMLPVLATAGIYVGVNYQNINDLFHGKIPNGVIPLNPDGTPKVITTTQYCQKTYGIEPFPYKYVCKLNLSFFSQQSITITTRPPSGHVNIHTHATWLLDVTAGSGEFPANFPAQRTSRKPISGAGIKSLH